MTLSERGGINAVPVGFLIALPFLLCFFAVFLLGLLEVAPVFGRVSSTIGEACFRFVRFIFLWPGADDGAIVGIEDGD